jgi:cytochrome c-type biogenesis protein CcmF
MIAELGQLALSLALAFALVMSAYSSIKIRQGSPAYGQLSAGLYAVSMLNFLLIALAFIALITCFLFSDFSVRNVAENSNILLPWPYKIAASWGSHEGSLLLWVLMLAGWTAAVAIFSKRLAHSFRARVLSILLILQFAFLFFLLSSSNPFSRILPAAVAGRDLNPLLQDVVMVIHPPMLYMGYVGFAVAFAFAVVALLEGRLDPVWARWTRPWANAAWSFLTVGIMLGSWWAYTELGWGGWWFWDPVENASLMPWLAGTALIHSLAVTDKRDTMKSWTVLLAMIAFALSLLGTFLVRSGVLTSVHAFATDPKRGLMILGLLTIVIGSSFALYAAKTKQVGLGGRFALVSRESMLLVNNVVMVTALFTVMLGTLYPLFAEVITGNKMSVGPPYFEAVFAPLLLPAIWMMSLAPLSQWKQMRLAEILMQLRPVFVLAVITSLVIAWLGKQYNVWSIISMAAAAMLLLANLQHSKLQLSKLKLHGASRALVDRVRMLGLSYWAMIVAHIGVAAFVAGVTMVNTYEFEKNLIMQPNQTEKIADWTLTFIGVDDVRGANYSAAHGVFELTRGNGTVIYLLEPEKRRYDSAGQVMTEAAIYYSLLSDIYVSLGEPDSKAENAWTVRVYYKPFISWVWIGCLLMAIGGAMTLFDKRYRKINLQQTATASAGPAKAASRPTKATKKSVKNR